MQQTYRSHSYIDSYFKHIKYTLNYTIAIQAVGGNKTLCTRDCAQQQFPPLVQISRDFQSLNP